MSSNLIYKFNFTGTAPTIDASNIPIINTNTSFVINSIIQSESPAGTLNVTVNYTYTEKSSATDGLSFVNVKTFYNTYINSVC